MTPRRKTKVKKEYRAMTSAQIGEKHASEVTRWLIDQGSNVSKFDREWLSIWIRDEVRKAIRADRSSRADSRKAAGK